MHEGTKDPFLSGALRRWSVIIFRYSSNLDCSNMEHWFSVYPPLTSGPRLEAPLCVDAPKSLLQNVF